MGTKWNHQIINVKLCYRQEESHTLYHVIIPEGDRFSWRDFVRLKDHLRSKFKNRYNTNLYKAGTPRFFEWDEPTYTKDQPVYEYLCELKDLVNAIKEFSTNALNLGEYEFSFSTIDYDYVSSLKNFSLDMIHAGETLLDTP